MTSSTSWLDRIPSIRDPNMAKRSYFTSLTPLPFGVTRDFAVAQLHDHEMMIEMNPLVIRHLPTSPPPNATPEEMRAMSWHEITDELQYLPGTNVKGETTYKVGFYDLPRGLQTHVFAPAGTDIQAKWSIGGSMPGEEKEPMELGLDAPRNGLYIREDVELKCNVFLANYVKRNLKKSHAELVDKLVARAHLGRDLQHLPTDMQVRFARADPTLSWTSGGTQRPQSAPPSPVLSTLSGQPSWLTSRDAGYARPLCPCEGGIHTQSCVYYVDPMTYHTRPVSPIQRSVSSFPAQVDEGTETPVSPNASWIATPTSIYSPADRHACFCTGAVHSEQCTYYPGLRNLSHSHTRSVGSSLPLSQASPSPQPPQQLSPYDSNDHVHYASIRSLTPEPRTAPGPITTSFPPPQRIGDQPELPATAMASATFSPADDADLSRPWPHAELAPPPLMARKSAAMELDGDAAVSLQRYYEYQMAMRPQPEWI